jgi:competence protein ComEC
VLRIDTAYGSMLLTGDIEARAEAVLAENDRLAVDVVVVPHHGSLTSSSVRFVEQADADVAVVSAGHNNRWGFPRPEVRARWESRGTAVMVTGELGAIDLHFAAGGLKIEASREKRRRYWHTD